MTHLPEQEHFLNKEAVDDFSVAVTYDEIKEKKYSLAAGQYFDVKIEYVELSQDEFNARMSAYAEKLQEYFAEGDKLKTEIMEQLKKVSMNRMKLGEILSVSMVGLLRESILQKMENKVF